MKSTRSTFGRYRLQLITTLGIALIVILINMIPLRGLRLVDVRYHENNQTLVRDIGLPPTWESLRKLEDNLPQHNLNLPFPEGRDGRYVKFSNQIVMLGWNNVLNEVLMNAHLAYKCKRAYVFQDYYWKPEYYPWPKELRVNDPPQTPLSALIAGTATGGRFEDGDDAPRSVSAYWFDVVCPKFERRVINIREVKPAVAQSPGDQVFSHWEKILRDAPERCVEVQATYGEDDYPQTFDLWLWGSDRILSLWETFSKSPTSRRLATSSIVDVAVKHNEHLFSPRVSRPPSPASPDPYQNMVAVHIRRGDFKEACLRLAFYNSTFYSWNLLPSLPDPLIPNLDLVWNTRQYIDAHMERCFPESGAIVQKAGMARNDYVNTSPLKQRKLDIMYLLTNEEGDWLDRLKDALYKDGWHRIVTSADLELNSEGREVNMAVDMDIARKAAVFIGNGWSSFTSNIVHRRLVDGKEPLSIRFW